jgi:hypothetical protein
VEDLVHLQRDGVHHVVPDQLEVGLPDQVLDVLLAAGEEVVEANDLQRGPARSAGAAAAPDAAWSTEWLT